MVGMVLIRIIIIYTTLVVVIAVQCSVMLSIITTLPRPTIISAMHYLMNNLHKFARTGGLYLH